MAAHSGIAAHLAYDMFSWYKCLSVILFFPTPRFKEWEFLSDCAISRSLPICTFFLFLTVRIYITSVKNWFDFFFRCVELTQIGTKSSNTRKHVLEP